MLSTLTTPRGIPLFGKRFLEKPGFLLYSYR